MMLGFLNVLAVKDSKPVVLSGVDEEQLSKIKKYLILILIHKYFSFSQLFSLPPIILPSLPFLFFSIISPSISFPFSIIMHSMSLPFLEPSHPSILLFPFNFLFPFLFRFLPIPSHFIPIPFPFPSYLVRSSIMRLPPLNLMRSSIMRLCGWIVSLRLPRSISSYTWSIARISIIVGGIVFRVYWSTGGTINWST